MLASDILMKNKMVLSDDSTGAGIFGGFQINKAFLRKVTKDRRSSSVSAVNLLNISDCLS